MRSRILLGGASVVLLVFYVGACSSSPSSDDDPPLFVESTASPLSFSAGRNDGYCASNPSAGCAHGTPLAAKKLALTFDDGPGSQTLVLSSWLKGQNIRATFFVNGKNFGANASGLLAQLVADGHLVGNHTQNHLDLTTLSDTAVVRAVADTDAIIAQYVPSSRFVFRAPFGAWNAHNYSVLNASAMKKYVGPVKWDIGGKMTSSGYAADWDCWRATNGYGGAMTSKQCGDRYLKEIAVVGRGIVLMHDADQGDSSNHNPTSGKGNSVDMVKYMVPLLKQQGYAFLRLDEVPDIAAAFPTTPPPDAGGTGECAFDPTWQQTSHANEWWVEYAIQGGVTSASFEVVGGGGAPLTLAKSFDKWVGSPASRVPSGTQVIVHARNAAGESARTDAFAYLVTKNPTTTQCGSASTGDAGSASDAGCTSSSLQPTWSQGGGANNWWVEYAVTNTPASITAVHLEVLDGAASPRTVPLRLQGSKWVGPTSVKIDTNANVVVHAEDSGGQKAETNVFPYLTTQTPVTRPCVN